MALQSRASTSAVLRCYPTEWGPPLDWGEIIDLPHADLADPIVNSSALRNSESQPNSDTDKWMPNPGLRLKGKRWQTQIPPRLGSADATSLSWTLGHGNSRPVSRSKSVQKALGTRPQGYGFCDASIISHSRSALFLHYIWEQH